MSSLKDVSLSKYSHALPDIDCLEYAGRVTKIVGLTVESSGPSSKIGDVCIIHALKGGFTLQAEVVGFRDNNVILMPFGSTDGIGLGSRVESSKDALKVAVGRQFIGRTLDGLGKPMDGLPPPVPQDYYPVENAPPNPLKRERINEVMSLGIKSIDGLLTVGRGQRLGIFAGSGVGKSSLLGMIARYAVADVNIITLVGERGREVRDFIERDLGEEGMKKTVLIVATSDQPALIRLKSAMVGTAFAEYFRDQGFKVLLLMDSLTRYAMAQREIGMATGEPPVSRGYPPSVYTVLPKLLERSGTSDKGSITGLYTVLVEGDDMNEPVADTVRGIVDGHIVLSRAIANGNHYPPIDIMQSVSRVMSDIVSPKHKEYAGFIKNMMSTYKDAEDLINIGAYQRGANPEIDKAITLHDPINKFLRQAIAEHSSFEETMAIMESLSQIQAE